VGWARRGALLVPGSSSTGRRAAALACATTLEALGWTTATLDATWIDRHGHGHGWGAAAEAGVRRMLDIPGLHDAFHYAVLRSGGRLALRADAVTRMRLVPVLRDQLDRHPVELVLSLGPAAASAVSIVAPRYPGLRHVVFCTEVSPHRLWIQPNVDLYLVRSAAAEPAVHRFRPGAKVVVMPPAVRPEFYRPPAQGTARIGLGVPAERRCVLVVAGSRGRGPVAEIASALAGAGLAVLAVAGHNNRLERRLAAVAERRPGVLAFGFTDRMPELMAAADLVITAPGSTCMEARTVGRPLLLLDLVQGHGRDDLLYELELGDASVASSHPMEVVRSALTSLERIAPAPAGPTRSLAGWEDRFRLALETVLD
jgi:processive 1,2-diacylglycerol beta-glucosyltransferase